MPDLITIPLPKGCILVLTADEYSRGLARGKARRRREAFERRAAQMQREREQGQAERQA